MFLMVPMVMHLLRGRRAMLTLDVIIAAGSAAAVIGIVQYAVFGYDHLGQRPDGSLSHYMTYSGVIMLVLSATVARLLYFPKQIVWPGVAVPALIVALAATNTRGAWLGAAAAIVLLVGLKRPKLLIFVPAVVIVAALLTPTSIQQRARSIFDPADPSNLDRIQMVAMGVDMVRDYPWFGVGPEMVGRVYGRYLRPSPVHTYNPHLHNVPMQIAAERGLLALGAWLTFVALAGWGLLRRLRNPLVAGLAAAGLAAVVAMLVAGLFEYNFGDSEFLMLFLALVTLPFAASSASPARDAAAAQARAA
jgi:O-antigen ligase